MAALTLSHANRIIEAGFAKGAEQRFKPLGIVVVDPGGHAIAFARQDGASMLRFEIAAGKAYGALSMGMNSRKLEAIAKDRPHFMQALSGVSGFRIIPAPGGVLVRQDGAIIGAVGVTGDTSDNDEICAFAGIAAAGLEADAG